MFFHISIIKETLIIYYKLVTIMALFLFLDKGGKLYMIHTAINENSRLVTFLKATDNNRASTLSLQSENMVYHPV